MKSLPNILSFIRIVLTAVFVMLYLQGTFASKFIALLMFSIAAITDYYDGYIARTYGATSKYGAFLDPLADKILTFSGFSILNFIDADQFPVWAIVLVIIRDLFTTFLRYWADKRGIFIETLRSAKVKTAVQLTFLHFALIAGIFSNAPIAFFDFVRTFLYSGVLGWAFLLVVAFTVYTGLEYLLINRKHLFPHWFHEK